MKVSAILVAATQAAPSSMHQWMVDNWWATAVETFNFASTNWEKFSAAVDGVRVKLLGVILPKLYLAIFE